MIIIVTVRNIETSSVSYYTFSDVESFRTNVKDRITKMQTEKYQCTLDELNISIEHAAKYNPSKVTSLNEKKDKLISECVVQTEDRFMMFATANLDQLVEVYNKNTYTYIDYIAIENDKIEKARIGNNILYAPENLCHATQDLE